MFPTMNVSPNIKNLLNAELDLYEMTADNACNAIFKITDLNLEALKQIRANWSTQSEQIKQMDGSTISSFLSTDQVRKNIEIATSYEQNLVKIMLSMQADMLKMVQQQAIQISSLNGSLSKAADNSMAKENFPGIPILQSMVEQASKGYFDWSNNLLHIMDAANPGLAHKAGRKDASSQVKQNNSK